MAWCTQPTLHYITRTIIHTTIVHISLFPDREPYDVVVTFEERVMEVLVEDMSTREVSGLRPCLVVNLDVKDNAEEAALAAPQASRLATMVRVIWLMCDLCSAPVAAGRRCRVLLAALLPVG